MEKKVEDKTKYLFYRKIIVKLCYREFIDELILELEYLIKN